MAEYNGFSESQRQKAQRWLRREIELRHIPKPTRCQNCGQAEGVIQYHAEDFNEPFGAHLYQYQLCYVCKMMLFCRFRCRKAFNRYCDDLRKGKNFIPFVVPSWDRFKNLFLDNTCVFTMGPARSKLLYDTMGPNGTPLTFDRINLFREPKQIQTQPNLL